MKLKNRSQSNQASRTLHGFRTPFLRTIQLCASSALAISTIAASAQAEEMVPVLDTAAHLNPSRTLESVHPARAVKQAAGLLPESAANPTEEAQNTPSGAIAQSEAPTPSPAEPAPPPVEPTSSPAEAASQPATVNEWQVSVKPYVFVPFGVEVDATAAGRSTSIDLGLDDILEFDRAFNAGIFLEAQKGPFGFIFNGFYVTAKDSGNLGVTFPAGTLPGVAANIPFPVRVSADASLSIRQGVIDLAGSYQAVNTKLGDPAAPTPFPRLIVSPFLGIRVNIIRQKLEVDDVRLNDISVNNLPLPATLPVNQDFRFDRTSVEPLLGAQIGLALSQRWAFGIRGDVSGFNVNADRNLTWNILVSTQYNLSPTTALQLGYRFSDFNFEDGAGLRRTKIDLRQNGLLLAVIFRF